jgi:transposase
MVAYTDYVATAEKVDAERGAGGFHHVQSPPPRRRTKRGQLSRGINRAGVTTKLHLAITADDHVVEGMLTGGNVSDISVADSLTSDVVGCYVVEDMGYDCDRHRRELEGNSNIPVIPGRKNRKVVNLYDKTVYKLRSRIELFFGKIKENRRLAVRYEKLDPTFLGFIALAIVAAFYL